MKTSVSRDKIFYIYEATAISGSNSYPLSNSTEWRENVMVETYNYENENLHMGANSIGFASNIYYHVWITIWNL